MLSTRFLRISPVSFPLPAPTWTLYARLPVAFQKDCRPAPRPVSPRASRFVQNHVRGSRDSRGAEAGRRRAALRSRPDHPAPSATRPRVSKKKAAIPEWGRWENTSWLRSGNALLRREKYQKGNDFIWSLDRHRRLELNLIRSEPRFGPPQLRSKPRSPP